MLSLVKHRRLVAWLSATTIFFLPTLAGADNVVVAQGSVGGVIGKQGKSISGGDEAPAPRPTAAPNRPSNPETAARSRCPNIVGIWNSWASGLFGKSDTTFNGDGTSIHKSGIAGKWWCETGQLRMSWGGETPKTFRLSDDRRQIIEIAAAARSASAETDRLRTVSRA